ncbi:RagB/SusD family nutrient uptake outer membrane protein [Pararcticibacter amylolyticus]|uniref:RagB/SusD family nutrient uptake outer membrane protein n=1 Tax=Pararcticibacter amylolyticus TaxID=2173175 RepID=A0A2U2PJ83_9SPHI|nr:RagB/SusD family nutrient uptake outer membrane protein [Pararcticibacter amylolyticus]PWG81324.1 RagB/SusD family nutrient uptake outer membrane protein [Pararcticibacter amylolyticus]
MRTKYIKTIISCFVVWAAVCFSSCEKYLDKDDQTNISEKEAFKNFTNFQGFTEELYNCIVNFSNNYWTNSWNWGEDEITSTAGNFHFIHKIDDGNFWGWQSEFDGWGSGWMNQSDFTTSTTPDNRFNKDLWNAAWYGIRKANIGLANMDLMTDATQEEKNLVKGQLLFFRGWFHHRLMEYFGGLPYIDYVLPSTGDIRLPRLKYSECADKAAADFRAAADLLPVNWDETVPGKRTLGKNQLRINKIMALAYLGKNYLWAGSPLMNFESTGSKTYNTEYCKKAAAAFGELLGLTESGVTPYSLVTFANYYKNFYTTGEGWALPGSTEAIFRGPYYSANNSNWGTSKQYTPLVVSEGDLKFTPTANYVDYYGMKNGLPIPDITQPDTESGYDPHFPWKNRDPRFYSDIVFDGVKFVQGAIPNVDEQPNRYANLYTNGSYRNVGTGSRTGYVLIKFVPKTANKYDNAYSWGNNLHIYVPYMRLADVYLMYAEAALMGYGSSSGKDPNYSKTAEDAVNIIRQRAGVEKVNSKFLGAPDNFLPELRRERAVELSFEGHRFNDLRRWLLLTKQPYTLKKSVEFDRTGTFNQTDASLNSVANLREVTILERKFSDKHYWLPLKNVDVNMYVEFSQNPGW